MPSIKPYFFRAVYQWAMDNGFTPQLLVDATVDGVIVPTEYVSNGRITLNIHEKAVQELSISATQVDFAARFSGKPMAIEVPMQAVLAVYARENGQGIYFKNREESREAMRRQDNSASVASTTPDTPATPSKPAVATASATNPTATARARQRPTYLKLVKNQTSRNNTSKG